MSYPELSSAAPVSFNVPPDVVGHSWDVPPAAQERSYAFLDSHWQVAGNIMADICGDRTEADAYLGTFFDEWRQSEPTPPTIDSFTTFLGSRVYGTAAAVYAPTPPEGGSPDELTPLDTYLISRGSLLAPLFETPAPQMSPGVATSRAMLGSLLRSCAGTPPEGIIPSQPAGVSADAPRLTAALVNPSLAQQYPLLAAVAARRQPWKPVTVASPHATETLERAALTAFDRFAHHRAGVILQHFQETFGHVAPLEKATHEAVAGSGGLVRPLPSTLARYLSSDDRRETTFPSEMAHAYLQTTNRTTEATSTTCADVATAMVYEPERAYLTEAVKQHEETGRSLLATLCERLTVSGSVEGTMVTVSLTDTKLDFVINGPQGSLAAFTVSDKGKAPLQGNPSSVGWRAPDFRDATGLRAFIESHDSLVCAYNVGLTWETILPQRYAKLTNALSALFGGPEALNSDILAGPILQEPNNFAVRPITTRVVNPEEKDLLQVAADKALPGLVVFWSLSKLIDTTDAEGVLHLRLPFIPSDVTPVFRFPPHHPYSRLSKLQRISFDSIQEGLARLGSGRMALPLELQPVYGHRSPINAINHLHEQGLPVIMGQRMGNFVANITGTHYAIQALRALGYPIPAAGSFGNVLNTLQQWQQELTGEVKRLSGQSRLADTPDLRFVPHSTRLNHEFADIMDDCTPVTFGAETILLDYISRRNPSFTVDGRSLDEYRHMRAITEPFFAMPQAAGVDLFKRAALSRIDVKEPPRHLRLERYVNQLPPPESSTVALSGIDPDAYAQVHLLGSILSSRIHRLRQGTNAPGDPINVVAELQAKLPALPAAITNADLKEVYARFDHTMKTAVSRPLVLPFVLTRDGLALEVELAPIQ